MNLLDREMELNYREITCKRSVAGATFAQGIQEYSFSVSGKNAWIPSLSYFVIQAELKVNARTAPLNSGVAPVAGGVLLSPAVPRVPYLSDEVTFSDHFGSCLYNNCFFRAGNSDVSTIMQYVPQAAVLKSRLDKSGAWSQRVGRFLNQDDSDFTRRLNKVSLDGKYHEDGLTVSKTTNQRVLLTTAGAPVVLNNQASASAAYTAATGVLLFAGTAPVNALVSAIAAGDLITLVSVTGPVFKVVSVLSATTCLVTPVNVANLDVLTSAIIDDLAPADPRCGFNNIQMIFQPSIGIMNHSQPLSGGDFRFDLNPNPNYAIAGIQSNYNLQPNVDYTLNIVNVLLYIATIKTDVSPTGIIPLSLLEMQVINKSLSGLSQGGTINLDFTVPPSTLSLTAFIQSSRAGTNTTQPPTQFYSASNSLNNINDANIANNVQFIQMTYGNVSKTQTLYPSQYQPLSTGLITDSGINYNIQRWLQSISYSGKISSEGGCEDHNQFLDRGNYWYFDYSRDRSDTSSYLNVQLGFNNPQNIDPTDQLFIVAHYSRQAEIQYENGYIVQVVSVNR